MAGKTFTIDGIAFPMAGETPTQGELDAAAAFLTIEKHKKDAASTEPPIPPPEGMSTDDEIADWKKYGRRGVEHKDMPSIARLPARDALANPGIFGTLLTANPDARAQIAQKQLPGSTLSQDKYGNPIIEYNGKKYYLSRPGEVDATDVAQAGGAVIASAPAMVLAPESLLTASVVSGLTSGGLSLAEDYFARQAGGTAQPIDPIKAGFATLIGTVVPPAVAKVLMPVAGRLNALLRSGRVLDDAAIKSLGIDPAVVTSEIRQSITTAYDRTFGNPQAAQSAYRGGLGNEFDVKLTKGDISQDPKQQSREKKFSGPGNPEAERIMEEFRAGPRVEGSQQGTGGQNAQLNTAQQQIRGGVGTGVDMTQQQASSILRRDTAAADKAAKEATDLLYDKTRNPFLMTQDGIPVAAPKEAVSGVNTVVRSGVEANPKVSNVLTKEGAELAPQAAAALKQLDDFSASTAPRTTLSTTREMPTQVSSPEVSVVRPQGLLAGEELPPGATTNRLAIDQPGVRVTAPAQPPSPESLLSSTVNQTPPGGPRIRGPSPTGKSNIPGEVDWEAVISQRKLLTDRMDAAVSAGNKTDQAALAQIIESFDNHFGPLNPNLAPARASHAERMATFKPGGSTTQDRATEAALDVLQGPEGGARAAQTIFGGDMKKGNSLQMIEHLNDKVFKDHPEAQAVLREQAVARLTSDPVTGNPLTPRQTVTAIDRALNGDAERPVYDKLFTKEQMARLQRFRDLNEAIAKTRESPNPSKSALLGMAALDKGADALTGGAVGYILGAPLGYGAQAAAVGAGLGRGTGQAIQPLRAQSAIRPPPGYAPPSPQGRPGLAGGLLATPTATDQTLDELHGFGPADRLMQSLLR